MSIHNYPDSAFSSNEIRIIDHADAISPFIVEPSSARFPRPSCNFDAVACSRNRHATLYSNDSQSADIPTDQQKIPSRELPGSKGDNIGAVDQHCHEMRIPVVDPRKSRRHGTDFGLGRQAGGSLTFLNFDHHNPSKAISVPLPLTTIQDNPPTDGDSVSSLFEYGLEFPQPPPIGSPVIRRMRSSPWFSDKDYMNEEFSKQGNRRPRKSASVLLDSDFRGPCYSISSFVTQQPTTRPEILRTGRRNFSELVEETTNAERARLHLSPYLDNDVSLEMVGEALVGLDMSASNMGLRKLFLDNPVPSCEFSQASDSGRQLARSHLDWPIPSDLLRWSTSHRSAPLRLAPMSQQRVPDEEHSNGYRSHSLRTKTNPISPLPSEHKGIRSLGKLPRIIRKVASMKSDSRRPDDTNSVPLGLTRPKTIPKSRSFRSIPLAACEAGNYSHSTVTTIDGGPHQHSDWSFADLDYFSSSKHAQDLERPFGPLDDSLRTFDHCKDRGTQHMSLPSSGFGGLRSEVGQHKAKMTTLPMALSCPFVHRETWNRPLAKSGNDLPNGMDNSFIDITPKQGTKNERSAVATKRAQVKKLIARAGNGIIGWGRQMTRKTSSVK
jgi:hypothetical protein